MTGMTYPIPISQVSKFEKLNQISVNVFGCEGRDIFPMHVTQMRETRHHVNLLFLREDEKSHYCLIRDLNSFLSRTKKVRNKTYFCQYCLQGFVREDLLDKHVENCARHDPQCIEFPENDMLKFEDFRKQLKAPFVLFCDFEAFVQPMDSCENDPSISSTTKTAQFEPCSFGYQRVCIDDKYTKPPAIYRGQDVTRTFLEYLLDEAEEIKEILGIVEPMIMRPKDERDFKTSSRCHMCGKCFTKECKKVHDHCHITGLYRGAAHESCNLNYKYPSYIPCVFHNLRGYDSHLICQSVGLFQDIQCIPNNTEKYISFSLGPLRFIDSFQFMSQSLETLTENLAKNDLSHFKHFSKEFSVSETTLLLRKGVYPYEYLDCAEKFTETQLPSKECFYSSLTKSHISEEDYVHAQKVWKEMKINNLGEYQDLYLKTDVLLLADVFENFRAMCLGYYGLDAAHFFTAPGLAWSSALRMTRVSLDLIKDPDMYLFFEAGIRGGVSMISNKYAEANNPRLSDTYNPLKPTSYIMYTDCNNLYGKAVSEPLPAGGFR
ncbi:uncharacterized protein [Argopecten irradians]|uniref:uncharacterized protein n=1 Tax=Argopecten irradians TaxID=31199 RepID=UPI0037209D9C